jgi:hypothetical protein
VRPPGQRPPSSWSQQMIVERHRGKPDTCSARPRKQPMVAPACRCLLRELGLLS